MIFNKGSANAPSHVKINNLYLKIEETKWSAAGMSPEAIERNPDSPDEDGKTTKGDQPPDGVSVDREPSEGVNNDRSALMHVPDPSYCTRSPPDVESSRQITNVEVPVKQQVSRGQPNGKQMVCTSDGCSGQALGPLLPYPVPILTPAVR